MRFQILTLFPELFEPFCRLGMIGRGIEDGRLQIDTLFLRDFAINTHGQVDDTPYGGGSGMVLRVEPAIAAIEKTKSVDPRASVVLFSPRGRVFNRSLAREISTHCQQTNGGLVLLCPRYEGVDERITNWVDYEVSLGDFVLMGGETAAMALIETISRFVPGVLGNSHSLVEESFEHGLLEYPHYTKPAEFRGLDVPPVLLSGHHAEIAKWRREQSIRDTQKRRPDILKRREASPARTQNTEEQAPTTAVATADRVEFAASSLAGSAELSLALIHYPVLDKGGRVITSSVTNLDLPDIARSAKTFGVRRFYVVHPTKVMRKLMRRICDHWASGFGYTYNQTRSEALNLISLVPDIDDVLLDIETQTGCYPKIIVTSARTAKNTVTFAAMRQALRRSDEPHLMLLGTGWGLTDEIIDRADYRLEPVTGSGDYNHLSVRGAAAIILDRLLGNR